MSFQEAGAPPGLAMSDEHEMLGGGSARLCPAARIAPVAAEYDESGEFPLDTVRKMARWA